MFRDRLTVRREMIIAIEFRTWTKIGRCSEMGTGQLLAVPRLSLSSRTAIDLSLLTFLS